MGNNINYHNMEVARAFVEKFPIGAEVKIDEFDTFIIDRGLASDPETTDTKSPVYKGFIQERSSAKGVINRAAASLNGDAFNIRVVESGKVYEVETWSVNAKSVANDVGNRVKTFTRGRFYTLKALHNRVESMVQENGDNDDPELDDLHRMLSMMREQGVKLSAKITGLVTQYNVAADQVEQQIRIAMDERKAIEDKSGE